jgi:cell division protein FtsQ
MIAAGWRGRIGRRGRIGGRGAGQGSGAGRRPDAGQQPGAGRRPDAGQRPGAGRRPGRAVRGGVRKPPRRVPGRRLIPRPGLRLALALVVMLALLGGVWLWLRDSSLVAVRRVTVTGANGPDASQIRSALITAAHNMTTLDVSLKQLNTAVAPYPVVRSLSVTTQFPHGMRIRVIEQIPVAQITIGGLPVAVAGDGTLLDDGAKTGPLPAIALRVPPGGSRLSDPVALGEVALLAAAPYQLLAKISQATSTSAHGLVVQLRGGPSIYFGDAQRLDAKWTAAVAVLADPLAAGALYIDVTDPQRPAAGAGAATPSGTTSPAAATSPSSTGG